MYTVAMIDNGLNFPIPSFDAFIKYKTEPNIVPNSTAINEIINVILAPSKKTGKYSFKKLKSN